MAKSNMRIGYIVRYGENSKGLRYWFHEASYTRRITSRGDNIYSKMLCFPVPYSEVEENTKWMNDGLIVVSEPFFLDEALKERATKWVDRVNSASPEELSTIFKES